MSVESLTERERQILEHLERAQSLEVSLKEYAEAYALDVRDLYNGKSQLVKKGVLPGRAPADPGDFVPVRITPSAFTAPSCRLMHPSGWSIELSAVPDVAWLRLLMAPERDAAT